MPRAGMDEIEQAAGAAALTPRTLQSLKRARPLEPRLSAAPCMLKCCTGSSSATPSTEKCAICSNASPTDEDDTTAMKKSFGFDAMDFALPAEDEFNDDFSLGPPPPMNPVLMRQNAMDASLNSKRTITLKPSASDGVINAPALFRQSRSFLHH
ncbi:hypothetical protein Poli38472_007360 [Pythium oligandrum]|uniref:Uncharacterized protein n=1 Tax=Pythium oligandrum TaxID=41045 RepID=A0A8K1C9Y3_PYTOL|nr:hypothetical protein Poli38472_007360 [Pythium oligandrum]|eukprot:TMW59215.1 hypothetical protein Poli38472_007360 [Pythium oligandrum]